MITDKNNYSRNLGYYYGIGRVLALFPQPNAGDYFLNGETLSVWIWDIINKIWIDTNRVDSGLKQMLTDEEGNSPSDYVPSPSVGIKEAYFYVAENADCDEDESASPREITFTYFKNGNSSVSVEVRKTSIVILYWNGDYWETSVVPMNVDLSLYAKDADLQAEKVRATAAEQANAEAILVEQNRATAAEQANADSIAAEVADRIAAIAALNPQLLRGTLYLSSDSTRIYKDALMTQEYDLKEADGAGVWLVRGSMIVGFLIQGWFQATIYPHNADYMLHWKWNAEFSRWEWEDTPKTYAVTPEEKEKWNDAVSRLNDFLTSVDATDTAINKWKELENFLAGITDIDTLTGLLYEQETRLNDAIGEETARATKAENDLQASVTANTRSIETEVSRAKAVEQQLKDGKADKVTDAANGNLAAFDSSGNLSDSSITAAKVETFISTMPTATAENEGKIYLYTGTPDSSGTFYPGNKYICRSYDDGFRWESLNGYVIAPEGISGGGGTSLPDGTIVVPLKTTTIGGATYYAGTPLIIQNGGWYPWRVDTAKVAVIWDLPVASSENEGMTYLSLNFNNTPNPRGFYTSYKRSDGQYSWRKVGLLSEENFTAAEKEKIASIDGLLEEQKISLEGQITAETSRATAAEESLRTDISAVSSAMPSISDIDIAEIDSFGNTSVSGTYIVTDGLKKGFMLFENTGNNAQRQTLYMENTLKYRTRDAGGWGEWATLADFSDGLAAVATTGSYNDLKNLPSLSAVATSGNYGSLSNRPLQGKITLASADGLYYSSQNGVYVVEDGGTTQGLLFFSTVGNGGLQQYLLQDGTIKNRSGSYTGSSPSWNGWQTVDFGVSDYNDLSNKPVKFSEEITDLNGYTNEGIFFVKGTNDNAANLPITNTGETVNVAFTLLVSASKPITLSDSSERSIVGQNLTLANRIGSENKQYLRHAICDKKNGETTYTWSAWREAVTQTMLGNGGICTDADIDAAIDNGIYSGVASQSGILPAYSTFTMVVVNNYAATAAASSMGIPSDWRQVTQTFIVQPLCTNGQITEGEIYQRTGMGADTITWGELKPVGKRDGTLTITDASYGTGDIYALDFTADFDTICFKTDTKSKWKVGKIPQGGSGIVLLKKNIIFKNPGWKGPSDSSAIILNGVSYTFSAKISAISEFSINGGSDITLVPTKVSSDIPGNRGVSSGGLSCFELWLEVDHDAKTVAMTLIPKY